MKKGLFAVCGIIGLALLGALAHGFLSGNAVVLVLIGVLAVLSGLEVFYHYQRRSLLRAIQSMDEAERLAFFEAIERAGTADDLREITAPEVSLLGKALSGLLGVSLLFGPPVAYHFLSKQAFTWNAPLSGIHLLCMLAGAGVYCILRRSLETRFRGRRTN